MAAQAITLSSSSSSSSYGFGSPLLNKKTTINGVWTQRTSRVFAKTAENSSTADSGVEEKKGSKQSLFGRVTDALDFAQVRSAEDAVLLEEARATTRSGGQMSREQYGALRRKIGGTYRDFFKSYVEVDGQYVEDGWVDKSCKVCKKDTRGEARQVDRLGRYVHVACLQKPKSANFFSRIFSG